MTMSPHRRRGLLTLALLFTCACSSQDHAQKKDAADEDPTALLDAPVNIKKNNKDKVIPQDGDKAMMPQAAKAPAMPIDGKFDGWDASSLKTFTNKDLVELGAPFWDGADDLSMRVGVKSDADFVYFWLEVKDDKVIEQDDERGQPVDAIVLWLREPKLEAMFANMPEGVSVDRDVVTDLAIAFSPTGRAQLLGDKSAQLTSGVVWSEGFRTATGYGVEVAVRAEVFPFVATLPMPELAFRVEALDGDEPKRLGVQSRMSMLPRKDSEAPRYALLSLGGLLPSWPVEGVPGRADGLGLWRRHKDKTWRYTPYEVLPRHWVYMNDMAPFEKQLGQQDLFKTVCNKARFDSTLLEAYRSISDKHRVGLLRCAQRPVNNKCPDQSQTRLFWVHMSRKDDMWELKTELEVFTEPMNQCADSAANGELFRDKFTIYPLDFASSYIWAVGWQEEQRASGYYAQASKIAILNVGRKVKPLVGELTPYSLTAEDNTRTLSEVKVYLTELDDVKGYDICEIEKLQEQTCRSLNSQCQTREHGQSKLTHVKTWSPTMNSFEPYLYSKHPLCTHDFTLDKQPGYMLVHLGSRIGMLPSAAAD